MGWRALCQSARFEFLAIRFSAVHLFGVPGFHEWRYFRSRRHGCATRPDSDFGFESVALVFVGVSRAVILGEHADRRFSAGIFALAG
jgi:hypothetical protein